ncbi:UNVERIFIED_CONTAM: hypothetical protein FKN15_017941 [Acipenser sinensis]
MAATTVVRITARLSWKGPIQEEMPERERFIQTVIIDVLKTNPEDILGIQRNGQEKFVDVAMKAEDCVKKEKAMATSEDSSTQGVRLLNTVRFNLKKKDGVLPVLGRTDFAKKIVLGKLGCSTADIYCLQDVTSRGIFDVTFATASICSTVWKRCLEGKNSAPLLDFVIEPLFVREIRPLTVHMYNPYVQDADIATFLKRFCDVLSTGSKIRDSLGIWNAKRQFRVRLRPCSTVEGGVIHPPASFSIGGNRGYLYYPGQPIRCRKCGREGHTAEACVADFCRKCQTEGHTASGCAAPVECNLCGSQEHVFKNCPSRVRSYAEAARSASEVPKAACPVPAARTSIAREVSDAVGPAAAPPAAVPVGSAAAVAPVVSVSVAGSAGVVAEAGPVVSGKDADLSQASRVLAAAVAGAPPGVAGDCSSWGEIMDTQESKVMYSSVLRDPRVKSRREDIVSEDEQPAKISRSESRVSVSADVVGNVDISDFTESSESGGVPGCSQVFESFGTSDSSVGSGGGASPGLEIDAFSPASVDSEDMCFGNVEVFCSITDLESGVLPDVLSSAGEEERSEMEDSQEDYLGKEERELEKNNQVVVNLDVELEDSGEEFQNGGEGEALKQDGGVGLVEEKGGVGCDGEEKGVVVGGVQDEEGEECGGVVLETDLEAESGPESIAGRAEEEPSVSEEEEMEQEMRKEKRKTEEPYTVVVSRCRQAGQCTQKALRSWEEEDERSGKAETELFSGARSPRSQGGGSSSSSSKAPLCRD